MAQEIFKRYEKKYKLSEWQFGRLLRALAERMAIDEYGKHTISNIYFDTRDYELIRSSIERPAYKEKLRLRAYGPVKEDSTVFVELKKKYDGVVYKRRVPMTVQEAGKYLYYGIRPMADSQILREIDYTLKHYDLKPAAYIAYDRSALSGKEDPELRVTFDRNIRCRNYLLDLQCGMDGKQILENGQVLMEVKVPGAMPLWMSRLLAELKIYPDSFSKYGTYYQEYLQPISLIRGGQLYA